MLDKKDEIAQISQETQELDVNALAELKGLRLNLVAALMRIEKLIEAAEHAE